MSPDDLDARIAALQSTTEAAQEPGNFRAIWEDIRAIGAAFKETRYPELVQKNEAWNRFQAVVTRVKETQAEQRARQAEATGELAARIDALGREVEGSPDRAGWKEVWTEIRAISQAFKATRFPTKDQREAAWAKFQGVVDRVKSMQETQQEERKKRAVTSQLHTEDILWHVRSAHPSDELFSALIDAPGALLDQVLPGPQIDSRKDELKACSAELQKARAAFSEKKDEMIGRDKHRVFEEIQEAQKELDAAWQSWSELNQAVYEARRNAWRERVQQRINNLEERLSGYYDKLSKAEAHLSKLEQDRDDARSDGFRERVEGWIEEEQARIDGLRNKIQEVEGWLDEERGKLS